jgi:drug/metabolite transporter (DMT)-like permease
VAVAIVLAAGAAFLSALAVVLQRVALESAPVGSSFSPRLMTHALRKRGWLIGFGLMLCMFVLQASALRFGQLSVVQPVLTGELIFLVVILVTAFQRSVGWRELLGIAAIVAGLAGFFAAASPALGTGQPGGRAWLAVSLVGVACVLAFVAASRTGPRWWRAAALGAASAVLFACNAALTKTLTALLRQGGWVHVFENWDPYALGLTGACGLFLLQSALHAGPITASRTTSVIVNPLASILIGVTAFGERLRPGPGFVTLDVLALAIMCAGVVILIRSPLVAGLGGTPSDEYLAADSVLGVHKERTKFRQTERGTTYPAPNSQPPGPRTPDIALPDGESPGS